MSQDNANTFAFLALYNSDVKYKYLQIDKLSAPLVTEVEGDGVWVCNSKRCPIL